MLLTKYILFSFSLTENGDIIDRDLMILLPTRMHTITIIVTTTTILTTLPLLSFDTLSYKKTQPAAFRLSM